MTAFSDTLRQVASRVPETQLLIVMGTDGIPIERLVVRQAANLEAVAAEYTSLLKSGVAVAADTGLGQLKELSVVTEKMIALLVAITPDYFIFAGLEPGAVMGRARFALRLAGVALGKEFV